ncbi:endopeptidase La [Persicobacter psychrovividus]|uniref:Lon protease n=1 Tax=Persicobacter psychrovividus TaxID=387638 RepID=A0ABN6L5A3_9BACT|nr:Lon protease [Persicobacter psychrovividus]
MDSQNDMFQNAVLVGMEETENGEFISINDEMDEAEVEATTIPDELPILPIKNTVLFPGVVIPITVGRAKSIKLVKDAYKGDRTIGVVAQKNKDVEDPKVHDFYNIGTVARIVKMLVLPDGNTTIIIQGMRRFMLQDIISEDPYFQAKVISLEESFPAKETEEAAALVETLKDAAAKILRLNPEMPQEAQSAIENIDSPAFLTHFLSSNLSVAAKEKQRILETDQGRERSTLLLEFMSKDIHMLELKNEIQSKVHSDLDAQQRDYFLRQQMKVLQDELGQGGPESDVKNLRKKGEAKKWPKEVKEHFMKELDKLSRVNPQAPEYAVNLGYAEFMIDLPWGEFTEDNFDLKRARKILDKEHYGLNKVKERIIEYLAVLKLKRDLKGPILCLYGPPGVGKTSLGRSIANALGREYVRMSLGGLHDESEVRGHRKTYIGAMPGKILQNLKRAKTANPVFVLDEIDKVSADFRGDPSSALLEVLDPEQNNAFVDNYLEIGFDLSKVLFIATSNSLETIQPALRDRMEIIELTGYTQEEKVEISKKHLIPKQREEHGLKAADIAINKGAIKTVIDGYTRESGVRSLERKLGALCRNVAKSVAMEEEYSKTINNARVEEILGAQLFDKELYENNRTAGVVTGLAWTQAGGEILFIESALSRGNGKLTLSGQLGDVMKESAMAALTYLKSNAERMGIDYRIFNNYDLHIHVPAGAVPKDGPSAGITMLTSLASVFTQRKVRSKLAMTGEITLRGQVLPVGGIKEKLLAARRAGIKEIVLCEKNRKDVEEIEVEYISDLNINYVKEAREVFDYALLEEKVSEPIDFILEQKKEK